MQATPDAVRQAIRENVYDPEIGINVVDLGLLYDVSVPNPKKIQLEMTLTTAGCPLYDVIKSEVENTLKEKFGQDVAVELEWVWDPPWSAEQMSEDAKMELGYF
ncbi:MAG TPA: iron-sulfur cluster assembly protein [Candidatus Bipolaricaulota bacterium]